MTHLTTYQRLAEDGSVLSLRKLAARRLLAFEQAVDCRMSDRLMIEGCMRHEPSGNGRGTPSVRMSGSVSATTVQASPRLRVRDSHDARSASERSSVRPYSARHFRQDVERGMPPASLCGDVTSYSVPTWATELPDELRRLVGTEPRLFAHPSDGRRDEAPRIRQAANVTRADERRARLFAMAPTNGGNPDA